jgi:hypothetical protein
VPVLMAKRVGEAYRKSAGQGNATQNDSSLAESDASCAFDDSSCPEAGAGRLVHGLAGDDARQRGGPSVPAAASGL